MQNNINIDFNGKEINFFYGLSFLGEFTKEKGLNIAEIVNKINKESYSFVPELMYASYLHSCKRKKEEPKVTEFELTDLIEQTNFFKDGSKSSAFLEAFMNSVITSLPIDEEEVKEEDAKKK